MISLAIIIVLSMVFSIIPALRISSSKAIDNLKNNVTQGKINFSFRGVLVTMQFTIAIVLIAFTTWYKSRSDLEVTNLGFNQKNIIGIKLTPQIDPEKRGTQKFLQEKPAISEISFTQFYPGKDISKWGVQMDMNGEKKGLEF